MQDNGFINDDECMDYRHHVYVEKKNGCLNTGLKVGCGFILGIFFSLMMVYFWSSGPVGSSVKDMAYPSDYSEIGESNEPERPVQFFQVRSKKAKATIHTGMSKDSVLILLGQPTEFSSSDYHDEVTYRYGSYDLNSLRIEFRDGKISSVSQH